MAGGWYCLSARQTPVFVYDAWLPRLTDVPQSAEYRFYTEFQSHEPEFDYLKSLEIEEKINQIRWLKRTSVCS